MSLILIGMKTDPQSLSLCRWAELALFWEDFSRDWNFGFSSQSAFFDLRGQNSREQRRVLGEEDRIYLRFSDSNCPHLLSLYWHLRLAFDTFICLTPWNEGVPSKARQQSLLASDLPLQTAHSYLCKRKDFPRGESFLVKGMSQRPSLPFVNSARRSCDLVMLQKEIKGSEYKLHILERENRFFCFLYDLSFPQESSFFVSSKSSSHREDFSHSFLQILRGLSRSPFFDVDLIKKKKGMSILEWNESPCNASFEKKAGWKGVLARFLAFKSVKVLLCSREESLIEIWQKECQQRGERACIFCFEDLGLEWTFSFFHQQLLFYSKGEVFSPEILYHRSVTAHPSSPSTKMYFALLDAIDIWEGDSIGQKKSHVHNASKAFQLHSLRSYRAFQDQSLRFPRSFFVKGKKSLEKISSHSLILKGCSGHKSRVASQKEYRKWGNHFDLPCFFQEEIQGRDLRIHACRDSYIGIEFIEKQEIDYRYGSINLVKDIDRVDKKIEKICSEIQDRESLLLVGIDLILSPDGLVYLEANPSPAWYCFYRGQNEEIPKQISRILEAIFPLEEGRIER